MKSWPPIDTGSPARGAAPRFRLTALLFVLALADGVSRATDAAPPLFKPIRNAQFQFTGVLGQRINANVEHWLLRAPAANPGMIEMFHLRDRKPEPNLVPWAGEFAGKYLISGIQAMQMDPRPELRQTVAKVVVDLMASQAEDGYLGPFPKPTRLRANWDLWGHYHCVFGLMLWHEATGDPAALASARRAADLVCKTFLDDSLRVIDAGSPEMNMAIMHGLGRVYRVTPKPRYLQMMREIEKDWERAGDYLRTGLAGTEFYKTPWPRWESLYDLQGLAELYRITGEEKYRTAFLHHQRSILRWDRCNTGALSGGEKATGNAYLATPITTCGTVAWLALTIDALALTGDSRCADELELSTFNAAAGAQHPSGRWWTHDTPMDGVREASSASLASQARAGTPELNCCSVGGPRSLGMLAEWAVMSTSDGIAVNFYGPGSFQGKLPDNSPVALKWETSYPLSEKVVLRVDSLVPRRFNLKLRVPEWSKQTIVRLNNSRVPNVLAGRYLELSRRWDTGDRVTLEFDFALRTLFRSRDAAGVVSIYRGPLLLAYDQRHNAFDGGSLPEIEPSRLSESREVMVRGDKEKDPLAPWLLLDLPAKDGNRVRVCDFASAGNAGTQYRSWLPHVKSTLDPKDPNQRNR